MNVLGGPGIGMVWYGIACTLYTRKGGGEERGEKRSLNPYECFSARLAVFGTSKPNKNLKPPAARALSCRVAGTRRQAALSMFWVRAGDRPPNHAQCLRQAKRGGAPKKKEL